MVDLNGSRLTDICPPSLVDNAEARAFSEAVGRQVAKLCTLADTSRSYAMVDSLTSEMCDMLAAELRTPGYDGSDDLATRRAMLKHTLVFYQSLGTVSAINAMISLIYGKGRVMEWPEYSGSPYHYKVLVLPEDFTVDRRARFIAALKAVANARSILDDLFEVSAGMWGWYLYKKTTWSELASETWTEAGATT
jgi:P2-related tail formation protein